MTPDEKASCERALLDERFKRVWDQFDAIALARKTYADTNEDARKVAFGALERRLESMNEFRAQLLTQAATFVTNEKFDVQHSVLEDRVSKTENKQSNMDGRFWVLGVVLIVVQLAIQYLTKSGGL